MRPPVERAHKEAHKQIAKFEEKIKSSGSRRQNVIAELTKIASTVASVDKRTRGGSRKIQDVIEEELGQALQATTKQANLDLYIDDLYGPAPAWHEMDLLSDLYTGIQLSMIQVHHTFHNSNSPRARFEQCTLTYCFAAVAFQVQAV